MVVKLFQFQKLFELLTFNGLLKLSKALKTEKEKRKSYNDMIHKVKRHIVVLACPRVSGRRFRTSLKFLRGVSTNNNHPKHFCCSIATFT